MKRRFEVVSKKVEDNVDLPVRATEHSAGYDIAISEDARIEPNSVALVPTGVKAYMNDGEVLVLVPRSSLPRKKGLMMPNSVGIIDGDYVDNEDNEGEIFGQFYNFTDKAVELKKGEKLMQGIFIPYLQVLNDMSVGVRSGGFGSTDARD